MSNYRTIKKINAGAPAIDGAGVHLVRVIGYNDTSDYDPFLMLDAFDSTDPQEYIAGFPWHPHRGIETITYLIKGEMEHGDSNGNHGVIHSGDAQWMTAGSGIIHQELPRASEHMLGAQLWLNLPKKSKMTQPAYGAITSESVPVVNDKEAVIRILSGSYMNHKGAFQGSYIPAVYLDVEIKPDGTWECPCNEEDTVFIYLMLGSADFSKPDSLGEFIPAKRAVLFDKGDMVHVHAGNEGARMLMLAAKPLGEPVAWGGPIVMNTQDEIDEAFAELRDNTFLRSGNDPGEKK